MLHSNVQQCQQTPYRTFAKPFLMFINLHCLHLLNVVFFSSFIDALLCITPFYSEEKSVPRHPCAGGVHVCSHMHADRKQHTIRLLKILVYSATSG